MKRRCQITQIGTGIITYCLLIISNISNLRTTVIISLISVIYEEDKKNT